MVAQPTVYVVDDDPDFCESVSLMVSSVGLTVESYGSAEEFLDGYANAPDSPKCLVLDIRMPGLSGLGLQNKLAAEGDKIPIIIISGCADVSTAVQVMADGAVDLLEKPFTRAILLKRIHEALDRDVRWRREEARRGEVTACLSLLSPRQRDVLDLLVAGKNSKQIAAQYGIGEKTVAKHRVAVFEKMRVDGIAELVRFVDRLNLADRESRRY